MTTNSRTASSTRTYAVQVRSPMRHLSVFFTFIVSIMAFRLFGFEQYPMIEYYFYSLSKDQALLVIGVYMLTGYLLGWRLGAGRIQLSINQNGIKWHWQRRYPWSKADDFKIDWSNIRHYSFPWTRYYYCMKLSLNNGSKTRLFASMRTKSNDFLTFKEDFLSEIERWNEQAVAENHSIITKPPSFYESKTAYVLIYIIVAFIIGFTVAFIFFYKEYMPPLIAWIVVIGASYMYIGHVISTRSKVRKRNAVSEAKD